MSDLDARTWADWFLHHARERPTAVAVRDEHGEISFGELLAGACGLLNGLAARGIGSGSVISAKAHNHRDFAYLMVAAGLGGVVLSPINPNLGDSETATILERSGSKALFITGDPVAATGGRLHVAIGRPPADGELGLAQLTALSGDLPPTPNIDDPVLLLMTSGTESRSKLVVHSHASFWDSTVPVINRANLGSSDVVLVAVPITSSTGLHGLLYTALAAGSATVMLDGWKVERAAEFIAAQGVTFSISPTTILFDLVHYAKTNPTRLDSIRLFVCGGAPIPRSLVEEAAELLSCEVVPMYGSSEVLAATMGLPGEPHDRLTTTDGFPLDGVSVQVRLEDGSEAAPGVEGELWVAGVSLFTRYLDDPQLTDTVLVDGWCRTGDVGVVDELGYVVCRDRIKDIVVRGGLNVSSREVENVLIGHPLVFKVAIVGAPDPRLGERICAVVVPVDDAELKLEDLVEFASNAGLSRLKWPEYVVCVSDLPTNATGKVLKRELRESVADLYDREAL